MRYLQLSALLFFHFSISAQFTIDWDQSYGGTETEEILDVIPTSDGGYLVAGHTNSPEFVTPLNVNARTDAWLLKISSEGEMEWQRSYGGSRTDVAVKCLEIDGGYILAGYTSSEDGDISLKNDGFDIWLVKVDYQGGLTWQKAYGGNNADYLSDFIRTSEGGYAILGYSRSDDQWGSQGSDDVLFIKIDVDGNQEWAKTYGGSSNDIGKTIVQNTSGQFIIGSKTSSGDGDVSGLEDSSNFWLMKTTELGQLLWQKTYGGGSGSYQLAKVLMLPDQNILMVGTHGGYDIWVVKVDSVGNFISQNSIGGLGFDFVTDCLLNNDGRILCVGQSNSVGGEIGDSDNTRDALFFEVDYDGELVWADTYGGSQTDIATVIKPTLDGGYVINVNSNSSDEDITEYFGKTDCRLLKLEPLSVSTANLDTRSTLRLYPNPSSSKITIEVSPEHLGSSYTIYDRLGQSCAFGVVEVLANQISVDCLQPGDYTIKIQNPRNGFYIHFVKL